MNGCDYNHLIKGRERAVVTLGIIILCVLFHILPQKTAECAFLNGFMELVFTFLNHHSNVCS